VTKLNTWVMGFTAGVAIWISGCQSPLTPASSLRLRPDSHLIFNPEWTNSPVTYFPRYEWPIATVRSDLGETVDYTVFFHDRAGVLNRGLSDFNHDVERRVVEIRVGSGAR